MKNKLVSKMLAAALSATMVLALAGCGETASVSSASASTSKTEASVSTSTESSASVSEEAKVEEPEYDFGGREFKIGSYYDMTPDPNAGALEAALAERIAEVESKYNCKITFVDLGDDYVADYVTSVLAGDPIVDVGYVITHNLLPSLIEGGIAYPLSELDALDLSEYKWRSDVVEAGTYKGKQYAMLLKDPEIRYGIFWNRTLFDKYGLPNLYDLVDSGEWTWEKFQEIASQGNQDTDGDGEIDLYGFNARENLAWCYLYSDGAYVCDKTADGIKVDLSDPKVVEALTGLQNFTQNVKFRDAIDWSVEGWDSFIKDFRDGKYMMCLEEFWISYAYLNKEEDGMQDDWGWVPFPKGPSATGWSCYGKENGARFILNGVENPQDVALVYDLITDLCESDDEWDDLMEDKLDNWCDDAKTVELVSNIYNNKLSVINGVNGFGDLNGTINEMIGKVASGELTPQTALDTYQTAIDAAIADISNHDYNADMQEYTVEESTGE
ncbi:MAG: hypothetical protein K6E19_06030 [Lachnospiraceae bacterium]|nr:hypothetical protein [Lachnospiraceae bacterium]